MKLVKELVQLQQDYQNLLKTGERFMFSDASFASGKRSKIYFEKLLIFILCGRSW